MSVRPWLPRTVVILGCASFLNDAASEMVTPLLPLFLTATLGAGPAIVGFVEGLGNATASVLKLVSGRLCDAGVAPRRLVLAGYGLSNVVRPLIGLASAWGVVLGLRFADRIGKGVRGTPRDALMAAASGAQQTGRVFGFHRAMDHAGATVGPLLAFALLSLGLGLREVFLWSVVPGVVLLGLLWWGVPAGPLATANAASSDAVPLLRWRSLDTRVRGLLLAASTLAVAAVPDAFLVLWASEAGVPLAIIPLLWAVAHALRALTAGLGGECSDHIGRVPVVLGGWSLRVLLLLALARFDASGIAVWALFLGYAATTSLTEPAEIAFLSDCAPAAHRATVFGIYHLLSGLLALPGALLFGLLWQLQGKGVAFLVAAVFTVVAACTLLMLAGRSANGARA